MYARANTDNCLLLLDFGSASVPDSASEHNIIMLCDNTEMYNGYVEISSQDQLFHSAQKRAYKIIHLNDVKSQELVTNERHVTKFQPMPLAYFVSSYDNNFYQPFYTDYNNSLLLSLLVLLSLNILGRI